MTTHGFLSIEKRFTKWSRADIDAYLTSAAVGLIAGLAVTFIRTPLHLPGHKVLLWMTPILACRIATRARAGASTSVLGTIIATLLLGGELGGGAIMMPLVLLAGITLDIAAAIIERHKLSATQALTLIALAGVAGNLICLVKRLFNPIGELFSSANLHDLLAASISYAAFGLIAAICGLICGWGINRYRMTASSL